jgi:voltage-gated potassium channel
VDETRRAVLYHRVERATEQPMLLLAVIFMIVFLIPEVIDVSEDVSAVCEGLGWILWAIFLFETATKTYLAPDRKAYLRSHWLEVATILVPFLRPIRVLIVSLRLFEEARTAIRHRTFSFVGMAGLLVISLATLGIYAVERNGDGPIQTPADALWWAMATITTVGYGDVYPKTPLGRAIAVFLMLAGISLFGLLTARIASLFVKDDEGATLDPRLDEVLRRLEQVEQQNRTILARLDDATDGSPEPSTRPPGAV